jgi:ClpP class serine protease
VAFIGAIGVVAQHVDVSGAERLVGMKTTEVTAGRFKRIASAYAPLSDEGRAVIQDQVDHVYASFLEAVAEGRRAAPLDVLDRMADGRTFIGRQAVEAGLADAVCGVRDVLADLRTLIGAKS